MVLGCTLGLHGFNFSNLKLAKVENQYHFRSLYKPTKLHQKPNRDCSRTFLVRANGKAISFHSPRECLAITMRLVVERRSKEPGYRSLWAAIK